MARSHLVSVVGAAGAGKTTLLAAHWIAARRGIGTYGRSFAGSYSLSGWHQIARHLQWIPYGSGFPPHTSAVDERSPALLHMVLDGESLSPRQILYPDAPGEWYTRWAEEPGESAGAQWVADHSDAFVVLADSAALSGADRGTARSEYEALALQLATAARGRPVIPVLTKADIAVPAPILDFIEDLNERMFGQETFRVSVKTGVGDPATEPVDRGVAAALVDRYAHPGPRKDEWALQLSPVGARMVRR